MCMKKLENITRIVHDCHTLKLNSFSKIETKHISDRTLNRPVNIKKLRKITKLLNFMKFTSHSIINILTHQ